MRVVMWIMTVLSLLMFFVGMSGSVAPKREIEDRKVDLLTSVFCFVFLVVLMVIVNPRI